MFKNGIHSMVFFTGIFVGITAFLFEYFLPQASLKSEIITVVAVISGLVGGKLFIANDTARKSSRDNK